MKSSSTRNLPYINKRKSAKHSSILELRSPNKPNALIQQLERKIDEQRADLDERSQHVQNIIDNVGRMSSALEKEKRKAAEYKFALESAQSEISALSSFNNRETQELRGQIEALTSQLACSDQSKDIQDKANSIKRLEYSLALTKSQNFELEKKVKELETACKDIGRLEIESQKKNELIAAETAKNEALSAEIEEYQQKLKAINEMVILEKNKLKKSAKEIKEKEEILANEISTNRKEKQNLIDACKELENDNRNLNKELEENKLQHLKDLDELKAKIEDLNRNLKNQKDENAILKEDLLKKTRTANEFEDKLVKSYHDFEALQNKCHSETQAKEEFRLKYEEKLHELEKMSLRVKELTSKLEEVSSISNEPAKNTIFKMEDVYIPNDLKQTTIDELELKLHESNKLIQNLQLQLTDKTDLLNYTSEQHSIALKDIQSLNETVENLRIHEANQSLLSKYKAKYKQSKSTIIESTKDFKEKEGTLQDKIKALQEEKEKEKAMYYAKLTEISQLKRTISERDSNIAVLSSTMFPQSAVSNLENKIEEMSRNSVKVINECSFVREELKKKSEALRKANQKLRDRKSASKYEELLEREKEFLKALHKLDHVVSSLETNLVCKYCLGVLEESVLLIPCGHAVCSKCEHELNNECRDCSNRVLSSIRAPLLDDLCTKMMYQRGVLNNIRSMS